MTITIIAVDDLSQFFYKPQKKSNMYKHNTINLISRLIMIVLFSSARDDAISFFTPANVLENILVIEHHFS